MNISTWEITSCASVGQRHRVGSVRKAVKKILTCDSGKVQHFSNRYSIDVLRRFPVDFSSSI